MKVRTAGQNFAIDMPSRRAARDGDDAALATAVQPNDVAGFNRIVDINSQV